jgi:hypothetical protein
MASGAARAAAAIPVVRKSVMGKRVMVRSEG